LRFNPRNVEAFYSLGLAHLKLGFNDKAVEHFQQTIVIDLYNSEAYYHLGLIYFIIENKDASIEQNQILKILDKVQPNDFFFQILIDSKGVHGAIRMCSYSL